MKNIKKIYFDMDGVLADFNKGVKELACFEPISQNEKDESLTTNMWNAIKNVEEFYYKLEPLNNALEVFNEIKRLYPKKVEILSAIPKPKRNILNAKEDKIRWVKKYLGDDIKVNIVYKEEKKNYCLGKEYILIDDLDKNINDWISSGGSGILFDEKTNIIEELNNLK